MVMIKATGSEKNNQSNIELVSIPGGAKDLLHRVNDKRELDNSDGNITNVTHISTSTYLLIKDQNENNEIYSTQELEKFKSDVSAGDTIMLASIIKLLVDNAEFKIPEGESILTMFASDEDGKTTIDAINSYLSENGYLDENGELTKSFQQALSIATAETVADPNVVEQFTADMLTNKRLVEIYPSKKGWVQNSGIGWYFGSNQIAMTYKDTNEYAVTKKKSRIGLSLMAKLN